MQRASRARFCLRRLTTAQPMLHSARPGCRPALRGKAAPVLTLFGIVKTETENNNKQLLDAHGINFASGADSKRKSSSLA